MAFALPVFASGEFVAGGFVLPAFILGEDGRAGLALPGILVGEYSSDVVMSRGSISSQAAVTVNFQGAVNSTGQITSIPLVQWELLADVESAIVALGSAMGSKIVNASVDTSGVLSSAAAAPKIFYDSVTSSLIINGAAESFRSIQAIASSNLSIHVSVAAGAEYNLNAESIGHILSGILFVSDYWDGWAYNLNTGAPSFYEQFKFNSFGRIGQSYFGLNDDGIYLIAGTDDDGADINTVITTGETDFGDPSLKTMPVIYAGIRSDGLVNLTARVDGQEYTYQFISSEAQKASGTIVPTRVKLGRGLDGRTWQLEITNQNGADIEIDALDMPVIAKSRRV